jgi:hypothetical protein
MPRVEAAVDVDVPPGIAFAVSQTTGEVRLRWDPFIHAQRHLDGATEAAKGVRTETRSRHRLRMVSEYVSFSPPDRVGMRMVEGPWFFERFGGGWLFEPLDDGRTRATWRYTFTIRPSWLAPLADPIGRWVLGRDIRRRIAAFADGCRDEVVLAAARDLEQRWRPDRPTG